MSTGFHRATVVDRADPLGQRRVRLRVPTILGDVPTGWALPMAGTAAPAVGDQVWATFEGGDVSFPVYTHVPGLRYGSDRVDFVGGRGTLVFSPPLPWTPACLTVTAQGPASVSLEAAATKESAPLLSWDAPVPLNFSPETAYDLRSLSSPHSTSNLNAPAGLPSWDWWGQDYPDSGKPLWFRYTPTSSGSLTVDLSGTAFDTVLMIYDGKPGSAEGSLDLLVDYDDDSGTDSASLLTVEVVAGTTYYVQAISYDSTAFGDITMSGDWETGPTQPRSLTVNWIAVQ